MARDAVSYSARGCEAKSIFDEIGTLPSKERDEDDKGRAFRPGVQITCLFLLRRGLEVVFD